MKPTVKLYKLGRLSYQETLAAQLVLFGKLKKDSADRLSQLRHKNSEDQRRPENNWNPIENRSSITNSLILVEHEPVYTVGIRTHQYNDTYVAKLKRTLANHRLKADFFSTNRGGLITFHGPGQLVAYPIIDLNFFTKAIPQRSVRAYVKLLESVIIDSLANVGIPNAHTVDRYPGVWLDNGERKIAFIGVACKRYVTMHGISINCDCNLDWFKHITSCGIEDKAITSIRQEFLSVPQRESTSKRGEHLNSPKSDGVDHIANQFCVSFSNLFECDLLEEQFPWNLVTDNC